MVHPDTELRFINKSKGRGVFATKPIPKGTLTYVEDDLEIIIPPGDERLTDPRYSDLIERFSFIDRDGNRIISWDNAKYVNHCCQCNTMSTGYGFEIAIRDIAKDEEITDEYSLFNFSSKMQLICEKSPCRNEISASDVEKYYKEWDEKVKAALHEYLQVEQPLAEYLSKKTRGDLAEYIRTGKNYISVSELVYSGE